MKDLEQLKNATLAELEKWEAEWRDAVGRRVEDLRDADFLDGLLPIEELDPTLVDRMALAAEDFAADVEQWSLIANAVLEARAKEKVPA